MNKLFKKIISTIKDITEIQIFTCTEPDGKDYLVTKSFVFNIKLKLK